MSSLVTAWSPSSYQLRFSFRCRKTPAALFMRGRIPSFHRRRVCVLCVAGGDAERPRSDDSWTTVPGSAAKVLSDWDVSDQLDDTSRSKLENGNPGIMGAGLAGLFLVAGLTFATVAISKKTTSRKTQEMKPLTKEQELVLIADEEASNEDDILKQGPYIVPVERNSQSDHDLATKLGKEKQSSSSLETDFDVKSSPVDTDIQSSPEKNKDALNGENPFSQEGLFYDSALDFSSVHPTSGKTDPMPEPEVIDELSTAHSFVDSQNEVEMGRPEEISENVDLDSTLYYNSDEQLEVSEPAGLSNSFVVIESSSETVSHFVAEAQSLDGVMYDSSESILLPGGGDKMALGVSREESGQSPPEKLKAENPDGVLNVGSVSESQSPRTTFSSVGKPAPSSLPTCLLTPPGKVLIPPAIDQGQGQALAALQVLKVIEPDVQPSDLCTRREYARWLVSASNSLSRNSISKVHPAMYIENLTELAYDDITPEDSDFSSIQGLAEAGLIASKLSKRDILSSPDEDVGSFSFFPDCPLCRQDLVSWKMALEKRQLPEADRKILQQSSGFIDIDRIDPDAWPSLVADLSSRDHGIIALAFGYTRLFQPDKPVTKAQAAIALSIGEASYIVGEELTRIEAESMAEKAVAAHNALVAEVEKDINSSFEKELLIEREKIYALEKMAEEASQELARLRQEREQETVALVKERTAIESEMEVLSRLRREVEEQLETVMGKKAEITLEKEHIEVLRKATEEENQAITRLQYELEVEKKALSMARAWAEDEAKRVREHAKALEEARERWEKHGIKVVVDQNLQEHASPEVTWINVEKQLSIDATVNRAENLAVKLKRMAGEVNGKSREVIHLIIQKISFLISALKEWASKAGERAIELKDVAVLKMGEAVQELQQNTSVFGVTVQDGARRVAVDCKEGVEKLSQKFKASS